MYTTRLLHCASQLTRPCSFGLSHRGIPLNKQADSRLLRSFRLHCYTQDDVLKLAPGQVDVWWLQPDQAASQSLQQKYMDLLSQEEQAYVQQGSSKAICTERLLARTLQRTTLARYLPQPHEPPSLRFERNMHGKPKLSWEEGEVQPEPPIHFSLTHTSSMLGIAVSCGALVGLDVEETLRHTRSDPLKLARRRLAPAELASLESIQSHEERAKRFVQLWTLKEAYVKAHGQGISAAPGLKGFSILLHLHTDLAEQIQHVTTARPADTAYRIDFQSDHDSNDWAFMLFNLSGRHTAALCLQQMHSGSALSRQESTDSDASASTVYNPASPGPEVLDRVSSSAKDRQQPLVVHRTILPLVDSGVEVDCYVQGASRLWGEPQ